MPVGLNKILSAYTVQDRWEMCRQKYRISNSTLNRSIGRGLIWAFKPLVNYRISHDGEIPHDKA